MLVESSSLSYYASYDLQASRFSLWKYRTFHIFSYISQEKRKTLIYIHLIFLFLFCFCFFVEMLKFLMRGRRQCLPLSQGHQLHIRRPVYHMCPDVHCLSRGQLSPLSLGLAQYLILKSHQVPSSKFHSLSFIDHSNPTLQSNVNSLEVQDQRFDGNRYPGVD